MSLKAKTARVAAAVVGMKHEHAANYVLKQGLGYKFIVMDGAPCARSFDHSNSTICLFSDANDRVYYAHPGTKGAYDVQAIARP